MKLAESLARAPGGAVAGGLGGSAVGGGAMGIGGLAIRTDGRLCDGGETLCCGLPALACGGGEGDLLVGGLGLSLKPRTCRLVLPVMLAIGILFAGCALLSVARDTEMAARWTTQFSRIRSAASPRTSLAASRGERARGA